MNKYMISRRILFTLTFTLGLVLAGPARAYGPEDDLDVRSPEPAAPRSARAFGPCEEGDPIDAFLEKCLEKDPSTRGKVGCIDQALELWEGRLNRVYGELMTLLDREDPGSAWRRIALRQVQLHWIDFRDVEYQTLQAVYRPDRSQTYGTMEAESRMKITKRRVQDLEHHLEIIRGSPSGPAR